MCIATCRIWNASILGGETLVGREVDRQLRAAGWSVRQPMARGPLDVLVGVCAANGFTRIGPGRWRRDIGASAAALFESCLAALPRLRDRGGVIVVVVSRSSWDSAGVRSIEECVSRVVDVVTEQAAPEVAVNVVSAGIVIGSGDGELPPVVAQRSSAGQMDELCTARAVGQSVLRAASGRRPVARHERRSLPCGHANQVRV